MRNKIIFRIDWFVIKVTFFLVVFFYFYIEKGQSYLSLKNLTLGTIGMVLLLLISARNKKNYFRLLVFLSFIPIIPSPLGGFPLCIPVGLFSLFFRPKDAHKLSKSSIFLIAARFSRVAIFFTLILTINTSFGSGQYQFYATWFYGIYFIYLAINVIPHFLNTKELIDSAWLGMTTTIVLSSVLYLAPSIKVPGLITSQILKYSISTQVFGRYSGILGDYELYGEFCGVAVLFSLYQLLNAKTQKHLAVFASGFILTVSQLLLTGTRSAILLTLLASTLTGIKMLQSSKQRAAIFVGSALFFSFLFFFGNTIFLLTNKSGYLNRITDLVSNPASNLITDRLSLWSTFLSNLPSQLFKIPQYVSFPVSTYGEIPHSLPLSLIFMFGVIPTFFIYTLFFMPLFALWRKPNSEYFILFVAILFLFADEFKIEAIRLPQYLVVIFTITGIGYTAISKRNADRNLDTYTP